MTAADATPLTVFSAFAGRDDLQAYGDNGLILFALQLSLGIDDIHSVAATALTDGNNDKKCDLVYVDLDRERVIVGQAYFTQKNSKEAPANKASDLNTAVTWLLKGPLEGLPENLRYAAEEVREAFRADKVREFDIWYCHNLPESTNVRTELDQVAHTAKALISSEFPNARTTSISASEIGQARLEEYYLRTRNPISVTETFRIPIQGGFEASGEKWHSFCTSVQGAWLRDLWKKHESDLMSPNVRDYLGIVRSERNINYGIKNTARDMPENFWVYNNGLTILVNSFSHQEPASPGDTAHLEISGMGIINGAQTTGSIGTLGEAEAERLGDTWIMARFVKCDDPDVLADIVKYNNTQNKVEASDFRSKDAVQDRLRKEFETIPDSDYRGGRRGGTKDAIERSRNLLPDSTVAQALAAFHGKPNIAYNDTRRIWDEDGVYAQFYNEKTTARHVVFTYSLLRAVESAKLEISQIPDDQRTAAQARHMSYFRQRGAIHLMVSAVAECLETIIGSAIPDRFSLHFSDNVGPKAAEEIWKPIVASCLPFAHQLTDAVSGGLKSADRVASAITNFQAMVEATAASNEDSYAEFARKVKYS
ncbi:AIPR family protein [Kitasatospora sp. NPDC059646]|uniref:AIPR family protein n=1 Tax=Kitasatospora sp. NPDC059646 TaxID=3346893 RepID=UPI0036B0F3F9